jgi:hydroxypyruvate isomerase
MTYQLSVSTEMMFREFGPAMSLEQLTAIRSAGIDSVEFWMWRDKDIDAVELAIAETGVTVVTMCADPQSRAVDPSRHDEFVTAVRDSFPIARRLGVPNLVVAAGDTVDGLGELEQRRALTSALRDVAAYAEDAGVTLALENLNSRVDHVGTFLDTAPATLEVIREVNSPNVKMLYDLYHSIVMDETPSDVLADAIDLVAHVQIADHPGRHEPGSGSADWNHLISELEQLGYAGAIGLEYTPSTGDTVASLTRIRAALTDDGN